MDAIEQHVLTEADTDLGDDKPLFGEIVHPRKRAFLCAFSVCASVTQSAKLAGVSRTTVGRWCKNDPEFVVALAISRELACNSLSDFAVERATVGFERLRFDKDGCACVDPRTGQVYVERICSDALTVFLMKHWAPNIYGDRIAVSGYSDNEIRVVFEDAYSDNPNYQAALSNEEGNQLRLAAVA